MSCSMRTTPRRLPAREAIRDATPPTSNPESAPPPAPTARRTAPRGLPLSPSGPRAACAATGRTCSTPVRAPHRSGDVHTWSRHRGGQQPRGGHRSPAVMGVVFTMRLGSGAGIENSVPRGVGHSLAVHAVHVLTTSAPQRERVAAPCAVGCEVVVAASGSRVPGREVSALLGERGYRRVYLQTGPAMLESAARDRALAAPRHPRPPSGRRRARRFRRRGLRTRACHLRRRRGACSGRYRTDPGRYIAARCRGPSRRPARSGSTPRCRPARRSGRGVRCYKVR